MTTETHECQVRDCTSVADDRKWFSYDMRHVGGGAYEGDAWLCHWHERQEAAGFKLDLVKK